MPRTFRIFLLMCLMAVPLTIGGKVFAEPVAPMLGMTDDGLLFIGKQGKTVEDVTKEIPTRESVGLPVYPGARFGSKVDGSDKGAFRILPAVNLVSTDPPEKIKDWYRKNLPGWSYDRMFDLFHEGKGKVDMERMMAMETITVVAEDDPGFDLTFYETDGMKSRIILRYEPKE